MNATPSFKTPEVSYSPHRHSLPLAASTISQPLVLPAPRLAFWSCSTCLAWGLQVTDSPWFHGMNILISPSFLKVFCWTEFYGGSSVWGHRTPCSSGCHCFWAGSCLLNCCPVKGVLSFPHGSFYYPRVSGSVWFTVITLGLLFFLFVAHWDSWVGVVRPPTHWKTAIYHLFKNNFRSPRLLSSQAPITHLLDHTASVLLPTPSYCLSMVRFNISFWPR